MPTGEFHFIISFEQVIDLHEGIIDASGGRHGILNKSALLSALARPYSGYYETLEDRVSALIESVVQNHGFVDGNKRTAAMLAKLMIGASFYKLIPTNSNDDIDEGIENLVVDLAAGHIEREAVRIWFGKRLQKLFPTILPPPLHSPPTPL